MADEQMADDRAAAALKRAAIPSGSLASAAQLTPPANRAQPSPPGKGARASGGVRARRACLGPLTQTQQRTRPSGRTFSCPKQASVIPLARWRAIRASTATARGSLRSCFIPPCYQPPGAWIDRASFADCFHSLSLL